MKRNRRNRKSLKSQRIRKRQKCKPLRRSAKLQCHPEQSTNGIQGRSPPCRPARKPKKVILEDRNSDYNDDDPAPEPVRPNTKQVSGRKQKFEELLQAIRNLSSKQQEELISEIQHRKNTARTNVGERQVLVPTGNADSQFDDKMPALPRRYKYVPEKNDDDTTWRSVGRTPRLWSDAEGAIGDIATYLHSFFIPKGHRAYAKTRISFASFTTPFIGKPRIIFL